MARDVYDLARFRIIEFSFGCTERSESILSCRRSYLEACVLASSALAVRTYESIEIVSSDRQLVFQRNSIAEVYCRIDGRKAFALGKAVHESFRRTCVSVRIHAERTESFPVRNYARIVLRLVS